jgi:hypothetical protein
MRSASWGGLCRVAGQAGARPRIKARAIRRAGELLKTFQAPGTRTDKPSNGAGTRLTQREAAKPLSSFSLGELTVGARGMPSRRAN